MIINLDIKATAESMQAMAEALGCSWTDGRIHRDSPPTSKCIHGRGFGKSCRFCDALWPRPEIKFRHLMLDELIWLRKRGVTFKSKTDDETYPICIDPCDSMSNQIYVEADDEWYTVQRFCETHTQADGTPLQKVKV